MQGEVLLLRRRVPEDGEVGWVGASHGPCGVSGPCGKQKGAGYGRCDYW